MAHMRKVAMWVFLGSECLFFGSLITTFLLYRNRTGDGPTAKEVFDVPFTSASSFILLMSSLTMVLAHHAWSRKDSRQMRVWAHGDCAPRHGVHQRSGVRVHRVRPRRPHPEDEPFRFVVLPAHRLPRRPRRRRCADVDVDGVHVVGRQAARRRGNERGPRGPLLALRRYRLDRHLSPSVYLLQV